MASLLLKKAQKASSQLKSKAQKEIGKRKSNAHISKELTTKEDRQVLDAVNDSSKKKKNYEKYLDLPVIASANLWKRRSGLGGKFRNSKQGTSTTTTTTSTSNSSWELRRFELRGTALLYYTCDGPVKEEEEEIDFGNETPENVKTDITREAWKSTSTDSIANADHISPDSTPTSKATSVTKMPRGCLDLVEEKALVHASHGHATGAPSPFCLSLVVGLQHEITKWKLAFDTQTEMMNWLCLLTDVVTQQSVDQYNVQLLHQLNPHFQDSNKGKLLRRPPPVFEPTSSNNSSDKAVENNPTHAKAAPSHHRLWFTEDYNIGKKHKTPTGGAATESTTAEKETNDNTNSKNTTTLLVQQLERQHAAELTSREQAYTSSLAVLQETIVRLTKAQAAKQEKHNAEIKDLQAELKQFAQLAVHNNNNNNMKTGNKDNMEKEEEDNENDTSEEEEEEEPDTSGSEEHHHGLPASDGWTLLSNPSMGTVARASSVLQRNVKTYGPMNALNMEDESSCWYSDGEEGATQSYTITFAQKVVPKEVRMQFQAGFSSETCQVYGRRNNSSSFELLGNINPEDSHELQSLPLPDNTKELDAIKFVFDDMTDFYGRVTIYRLGVYGRTATAESGCEEHHHDNEGGEQFASDDSDDDDFHDATAG